MKKRIVLLLFAAALLLSACGAPGLQRKKYQATFLTLFDTVTTVVGYGDSEEAFTEQSRMIHDGLLRYHQLFDIYSDYEGLNNLKTVNDQAGIAPVAVEADVIRLLLDCREYHELTGGRVDVPWEACWDCGMKPETGASTTLKMRPFPIRMRWRRLPPTGAGTGWKLMRLPERSTSRTRN